MLPICLGQATKVSGFLLEASKTYRVVARQGIATDTGDADGEILEYRDIPAPHEAAVCSVLESFVGELDQVPPMYSALKHHGQPLYKFARRGIDLERAARRISVHALSLEGYRWPDLEYRVHCSKGTYIRTLVADIAVALGTVAHVVALRRLNVEPFEEGAMVELAQIEQAAAEGFEALDRHVLPSDAALPGWPAVALDAEQARRLVQGQPLPRAGGWPQGQVRIYGPGHRFLGMGEVAATLTSRRLFVR
jgi:tRNA pseudouridine55 synthase